MLTFHSTMPTLSRAALRRIDLLHHALLAVLAGAAAWLLGPGGLLPASVYLGGVLAAHVSAEVALRRWARRRAWPFVPRRDWRAAWRHVYGTAPAWAVLVRAFAFGLAVAQVAQGRPAWALSPQGWAGVSACALAMFIVGLCSRDLPGAGDVLGDGPGGGLKHEAPRTGGRP